MTKVIHAQVLQGLLRDVVFRCAFLDGVARFHDAGELRYVTYVYAFRNILDSWVATSRRQEFRDLNTTSSSTR